MFPFDFTGYGDEWTNVTRIILVLAVAGSAISVLTESVRLLSRLARRGSRFLPQPKEPQPPSGLGQ